MFTQCCHLSATIFAFCSVWCSKWAELANCSHKFSARFGSARRNKSVRLVSGLTGFSLYSSSPYILFNTIPPCPAQKWEGTAVKEEEWRESTFYEGVITAEILRPDAFLSPTSAKDIHCRSSFLQPPTDSWGKGRQLTYVCTQTQSNKQTFYNNDKKLYSCSDKTTHTMLFQSNQWLQCWISVYIIYLLVTSSKRQH